jgi:hypothetical protein
MNASIEQLVMQFKHDIGRAFQPDAILALCRSIGHAWRVRQLDPVVTLRGFLLQVLHGNTACSHVPRLLGREVTAEAYGQARSRLPLEFFQRLLEEVCSRLRGRIDTASSWHGHRVWVIDGSSCSMPDTPELQQAFGQPIGQAPGCGFPVAHLMTLFHVGTGMLMRIATAPWRTHDLSQARLMHGGLAADDIVVADRGFCSFGHLAILRQNVIHAVFRAHQKQIVDFRKGRAHETSRERHPRGHPKSRWIHWLGRRDQIVEYHKPHERPRWTTEEEWTGLPATILVRELRYDVLVPGSRTRSITLVTSLLDAKAYPAADLAALYAKRWEVETNLRHLKQTLGMDVLRTKSLDGIHKELAMFAIVYNLVRLAMLEAAQRRQIDPDRVSFVDALRWLRCVGEGGSLRPIRVVPKRPGRHDPRVKKRRAKNYRLMTKPRSDLMQVLAAQTLSP